MTPSWSNRPRTSVVIAATPRSGSWLLADSMRALGTLGRPEEYLRADLDEVYRQRWGLAVDAPPEQVVATMLAHGSTRNGVFGLKLHWFQFELLLQRLRALPDPDGEFAGASDTALLQHFLGRVRWVHLERRDTVRQAVSWYRAIRTDEWWLVTGQAPRHRGVEYDFEAIKHLHYLLLDYRHHWRSWFAAQGGDVLELGFEQLSVDLEDCLLRVVDHVGVQRPARLPAPSLARQSDDLTDTLVARYERSVAALFGSPEPVRPDARRRPRVEVPAR